MPIKVTAYACEYECGTGAMEKLHDMWEHESVCFSNPAARGCQTCKHESSNEYDTVGSGEYVCKLGMLSNTVVARANCREWEGPNA